MTSAFSLSEAVSRKRKLHSVKFRFTKDAALLRSIKRHDGIKLLQVHFNEALVTDADGN
jgi:hypothetical protein